MKYEEPIVEILIFQGNLDVITLSETGNDRGDQGGIGDLNSLNGYFK